MESEGVQGRTLERGFSAGEGNRAATRYIPRSSLLYGHDFPPPLLPLLHKTSPGHILRMENYVYHNGSLSEVSSPMLSVGTLPRRIPNTGQSSRGACHKPPSHERESARYEVTWNWKRPMKFPKANFQDAIPTKPVTSRHRERKEIQEVQLTYNGSNTPKFHGKFRTVKYKGQIRRECRICGATYCDLKGFNRHYTSTHSDRPIIQRRRRKKTIKADYKR